MNKKLQVYWHVTEGVHRTVNVTAVLEVNGSSIKYEHVEYKPASISDTTIAQAALTWATHQSNEFDTPIEYGNNLGTSVSSVYGFERTKVTAVEDQHNNAWKMNVLSEARTNSLDRAGLIG